MKVMCFVVRSLASVIMAVLVAIAVVAGILSKQYVLLGVVLILAIGHKFQLRFIMAVTSGMMLLAIATGIVNATLHGWMLPTAIIGTVNYIVYTVMVWTETNKLIAKGKTKSSK